MNKESRHEKWRRLATNRMNRIFKNMNLIRNCSDVNYYAYSAQDVEEIFQAYENKGKEIRAYFDSPITLKLSLDTSFSFLNENENNDLAEDKHSKFKRVIEKRLTRVWKDLNLIANLSNRNNYTFTKQEVDELFQAYEDKGREIRAYFEPLKEEFTFSK